MYKYIYNLPNQRKKERKKHERLNSRKIISV